MIETLLVSQLISKPFAFSGN